MNLKRLKTDTVIAPWFLTLGKLLVTPSVYLLPRRVVTKADPERAFVDNFIENIRGAQPAELVLDAGAGNMRFQKLLIQKNFIYESQDFEQVFDPNSKGIHTYVCDITAIPVESNRFGIVVCTQVLEHLPNPQMALKEIARVLKPGGELFLTTNLLFPIHGAPYDFFRFTNYGLHHLCEESGFFNIEIFPRGGFFSFCAKIIFDLPAISTSWLFFDGSSPHGQKQLKVKSWLLVVLLAPPIFLLNIVSTLLAFSVSKLDWIDKKKRFTLGYQLRATRS